MADRRKKDANWIVADEQGNCPDTQNAILAVLMDIRDEMKLIRADILAIGRIVSCPNAVDIPRILRRISANTAKKRRKKQ